MDMVDNSSTNADDDVPLLQHNIDMAFYLNAFLNGEVQPNADNLSTDDLLISDNISSTSNQANGSDNDVRLLGSDILDSEIEQQRSRSVAPCTSSRGGRLKSAAFANSNFASASCNAIVVIIAISALVEPAWFTFAGSPCRTFVGNKPINHLGPHLFFDARGEFMRYTLTGNRSFVDAQQNGRRRHTPYSLYRYDSNMQHVLVDCVDRSTVDIMRLLIVLVVIVALLSVIQAILDVLGTKAHFLFPLSSNSVFSIFAVTLCAVSQAICYWLTRLLEHVGRLSRLPPPPSIDPRSQVQGHQSPVRVTFSVGFYLLTVCACLSILATGFNLLLLSDHRKRQRTRPRRHIEAIDFGPEYGPDIYEHEEHPPPPYTP